MTPVFSNWDSQFPVQSFCKLLVHTHTKKNHNTTEYLFIDGSRAVASCEILPTSEQDGARLENSNEKKSWYQDEATIIFRYDRGVGFISLGIVDKLISSYIKAVDQKITIEHLNKAFWQIQQLT